MIKLIPELNAVVGDNYCKVFGRIQFTIFRALYDADGKTVPLDELIHLAWAKNPPAQPMHSLATTISHMRRQANNFGAQIDTQKTGYRMTMPGCFA